MPPPRPSITDFLWNDASSRSLRIDVVPIDEEQEEPGLNLLEIQLTQSQDEPIVLDQQQLPVGNNGDAPYTPPPPRHRKHAGSLTAATAKKSPPEVIRQPRPINRRLLLQEAQDRLSLPDLFDAECRNRMPMMTPSPTNSSTSNNSRRPHPNLYPRAVQWGDYWDNKSHSISQRCMYSDPTDLL